MCGMQLPAWQIWLTGHMAPVQSSTQVPVSHVWPAGQVTDAHAVATHRPLISHVLPVAHGMHWQVGTHTPLSQTWPIPQSSPRHGSTHVPRRHTWPRGQVTPEHASTHLPPAQRWPAGQLTPMQSVSMQTPLVSHVVPGGQVPSVQLGTHCAPTHE